MELKLLHEENPSPDCVETIRALEKQWQTLSDQQMSKIKGDIIAKFEHGLTEAIMALMSLRPMVADLKNVHGMKDEKLEIALVHLRRMKKELETL